jgi:HEAT repeat protein
MVTRGAQEILASVAARRKPAKGISAEATWNLLASDDARAAWFAIQDLAGNERENLGTLRQNLQKLIQSQALDVPLQIAELIRQLDHDEFDARERATAQLAKFGTLATTALREAFAKDPSPEAKQRIVGLLSGPSRPKPMPERMQLLRGIEVLERMGSAEARQALETIAKAAPENSSVAMAARESAQRIKP